MRIDCRGHPNRRIELTHTRLFATRLQTLATLLVAVVGISITTFNAPVSAHEGRQVGDYNFVVGFLREPAYEGQLNAVSLIVTDIAGDDHPSDDEPATGGAMEKPAASDGHSHSHGDENTESALPTMVDEADVLTHGAVFISPSLRRNQVFDFEVPEELKGLGIPYHIHPGDLQGVIVVAEDDAHDATDIPVSLTQDGIEPKSIQANVGDTLVWTNIDFQNTVLMSGPLSSMTPAMKSADEAGTANSSSQSATLGNRVTGLSASLEVEITHVSTSTSRTMPLTEVFDDPGHYIAEFIPTAPGDYRVRFFGTIEGNAIDETFDSGPDTFDTVIASDAIQFPVVLESNREIRNAAQGALDAVQGLENDLDATSSTASLGIIIGIVGVAFAVISIALSVVAITISRRRK